MATTKAEIQEIIDEAQISGVYAVEIAGDLQVFCDYSDGPTKRAKLLHAASVIEGNTEYTCTNHQGTSLRLMDVDATLDTQIAAKSATHIGW